MKPVHRERLFLALYDLILVQASMIFTAWLHDGSLVFRRGESYLFAFIFFPVIWTAMSLVTRKFRIGERRNAREVVLSVLLSNFIIVSFTTILMVLFQLTFWSRFIFFGTVAFITALELATGIFIVAVRSSVFLRDWIGMEIPEEHTRHETGRHHTGEHRYPGNYAALRDSITEEAGMLAFLWIDARVDVTDPDNLIVSIDSRFNLINHPSQQLKALINLRRINTLQRINKFFETVNTKLPERGLFIGCVQTHSLRKRLILAKYPPILNHFLYFFDFLFHRVMSKMVLTRKLYFFVTRGKWRVLSRAEAIGRLYSCGFEVTGEQTIGSLLYWTARKVREPYYDNNPTYGFFIRLRRIGKDGREFNVFKLRTMYAYAEYIQHYVYEKHQLGEGGKFHDDFRVTTPGRILRKLWLDELPMVINVLRGEMKIVGVRPLSRHYFSLYTPEMQALRTRVKPGLIPPFYAQHPTPTSLDEVQKNEETYLRAYLRNPLLTDLKYFFLAMFNIVWRRARSR